MSNDLFGSDSNEREISNLFFNEIMEQDRANALTRTAQVALSDSEAAGADEALATADDATPEEPLGGPQDAAGQALPDMDTDQSEMEAIKSLIPWDSFSINFDPHYSKLLEEKLGLPPTKAKAKSFYIYFAPENQRLEGVVNKRYIGGFGTKEKMGEDLTFIKELSEEGFSPEWKEKLLTSIDTMPAVENSAVAEKLKEKAEEVTDEVADDGLAQNEVTTPAPAKPTQEMAPPTPSGPKVDTNDLQMAAKLNDIVMKRMSRLKAWK